jgi:hypothetical protein
MQIYSLRATKFIQGVFMSHENHGNDYQTNIDEFTVLEKNGMLVWRNHD